MFKPLRPTKRSGHSVGAILASVLLLVTPRALAQTTRAPSVIDDIPTVKRPVVTLLPKYQPELFVGAGYSGTFEGWTRQWPTLTLSVEGVLWRPGRFDLGVYAEGRLGRPDHPRGPFEVAFGPEFMWRMFEDSFWDYAWVLRGAYVLDTDYPGKPLIRGGFGGQFSVARSLAVQLTADLLSSPSDPFANGDHVEGGLSVTVKVGFCALPFMDCHQVAVPPVAVLDRSPVACRDAARVCTAARTSVDSSAELCAAARKALDVSQHPAAWGDSVGSFLDALKANASPRLLQAIEAPLKTLASNHEASLRGIDDYAARQRDLDDSEKLGKTYSYLVTPVMVRDWLGCPADPQKPPIPCASEATCEQDTGVK